MDLTFVNKLANENNSVKYPLVLQDLYDRTVDAKKMKTEDLKETACALLTKITEKNRFKKH